MTGTKSLKELKEENAQVETPEIETEEAPQTPKAVIAPVEEVEAEAVETDTDDEPVEIESWMQTEEADSEDDKKGGFKPNHEAAKTRKRLKAKLNEQGSELEEAKAEIERLRSGSVEQKAPALPPRPKREDFDYDDDAYDEAVDSWNDKKIDARLISHSQKSNESQTQEQAAKARATHIENSLDSHRDRVIKLVGTGKVTEDAYNAAEVSVRSSMEAMYPKMGDRLVDDLITTLNNIGEGSEKVMYQLGVNPSKMLELQNKIASDPTLFTAVAYLGSLQSRISEPTRKRSAAPKPSTNVGGEGGAQGQAGAMQKAYKKAGESNDIQSRISLKRKARAQGVDVSNW